MITEFDTSLLIQTRQVKDLIYEYKDAFSMRDEIGRNRHHRQKPIFLLDHFMLGKKIKLFWIRK